MHFYAVKCADIIYFFLFLWYNVRMKRFLKLISVVCATALLCSLSVSVAFAEKEITSDKYAFVGIPSGLFCSDDGIVVYSADKLYSFSYDYEKTGESDIQSVMKYEKNGMTVAYSTADGVFVISDGNAAKKIYGKCDDFTVIGSDVYIADGSDIVIVNASDDSRTTVATGCDITSVARCGNKAYYSVASDAFGYSDIYSVDASGTSVIFDYCKNVEYLLTGDVVWYYGAKKAHNPETGESIALPGDEIAVSVHGNDFYSITAGGELYKTSGDQTSLVFACAGNQTGFFAFPGMTYSDYGKLFVADYANNRIAAMSDKIEYIDITRPTAIASNYSGTLYAYGKRGLFAFNADKIDEQPTSLPYSGGAITSLAYGKNGLYILTDGKIYLYDEGELTFIRNALKVKTEYFGGQMYYLTENGVYKDGTDYAVVRQSGILDFDIGADKSLFCLTKGEISRYTDEGELLFTNRVDENATNITLSVLTNDYTDFGDVVVTCTSLHKVFNFKPSSSAEAPVADLTYTDTNGIIRTVTNDANVYLSPNSTKVLGKIPSGSTVIVGKYNLYETERMSYVLYEDKAGLKEGYVYKGLIGNSKPEHDPEFTTARTLYENTALYRFPSAGGAKLSDNVGKNVQVKILPFADYEADGVTWLKVSCGSQIGFIARDMLATNTVTPDDERPQYNADLKKDADIYDVVAGEYVITGNTLKSGTPVEIVGIFDQNSKYTEIRYFDQEKGVRTCYVLTETLVTYSITPLQIIGLVGVGIIAVLLVIVFVLKFASKRKRMLAASGRNNVSRNIGRK